MNTGISRFLVIVLVVGFLVISCINSILTPEDSSRGIFTSGSGEDILSEDGQTNSIFIFDIIDDTNEISENVGRSSLSIQQDLPVNIIENCLLEQTTLFCSYLALLINDLEPVISGSSQHLIDIPPPQHAIL